MTAGTWACSLMGLQKLSAEPSTDEGLWKEGRRKEGREGGEETAGAGLTCPFRLVWLKLSRSDAPASAGTAPVPLWLLGEWAAHLETPALQLWGTSRELGPEEPGQGLSCGDKEAVTALICGQKEGDNRLEGLVDLEVRGQRSGGDLGSPQRCASASEGPAQEAQCIGSYPSSCPGEPACPLPDVPGHPHPSLLALYPGGCPVGATSVGSMFLHLLWGFTSRRYGQQTGWRTVGVGGWVCLPVPQTAAPVRRPCPSIQPPRAAVYTAVFCLRCAVCRRP